MSTTPNSELLDFAEAPGRFLDPAPGLALRVSQRYALSATIGHTYAAVEGIRLRSDEIPAAVADVDAFLHESETRLASWWLTERSTPADIEERLLAAGAVRRAADYLHAALLLTDEPPQVEGIEAREVTSFEEYAEARRVALEAFADPNIPPPAGDVLRHEWDTLHEPLYAAWLDGRIASVGRAAFTRVGGYLTGGATARWARGRGAYRAVVRARWDAAVERGTPALAVGAGDMSRPILERLGFRQVLQFRRLESVRSGL